MILILTMNKKMFSIFVICSVIIAGAFVSLTSNDDNSNSDFDYCSDNPTLGIKYQNCNTPDCVVFHESIKKSLKERYCKE